MDDLERFVQHHRPSFDQDEPSDSSWRVIQGRLERKSHLAVWWKVAAVLFLGSTLYLAVERFVQTQTIASRPTMSGELTEFRQAESYYSSLIDEKRNEISQYDRSQLTAGFLAEIDKLDQMYTELKETYDQQNSTDILVDAMISNLKLRIDILNQQLKVLKQLKEEKNENDVILEI